mmetsp:Transcript_116565/g.226718  ORF Transcript_116565/g.226718 Transcript_116565/m.226718 type:complete len:200 (-) Transcript_116565:56-655(-)
MTTFKSDNSGGIVFCLSCSWCLLINGKTNGATHSSRYFCSGNGMPTMTLKSPGNRSGCKTSPLTPWQCSQSPSIQSVSSCRSSMGIKPVPGALLSNFGPQVGTCSANSCTKKFNSAVACLVASSFRDLPALLSPLPLLLLFSNMLITNCDRAPLRRTISSTKSPRTFALMSLPNRMSNLSNICKTPCNNGMAHTVSNAK